MTITKTLLVLVPLSPLTGAIVAGIFGKYIGRSASHFITIALVGLATVLSGWILYNVVERDLYVNTVLYVWSLSADYSFEIGFLIDSLSSIMMFVVTFVSLMVHVYTIGYMADDSGYQRFFSYISLFTFAMLMLVMSNNFLQLFFGWEAVGLISYLLIGFWHGKPSAISANLKAFLVNRVGDLGFILGVALILVTFGTLDYKEFFRLVPEIQNSNMISLAGFEWSVTTTICLLLFIGAMGKSAQVPLHVWLPDSMEGPTPISALIHAATMVTAGIFMVARMSPAFELSSVALSVVVIIGSITALFTGILGLIQSDIKKVVAYSTLSQLGYMTVALGVSAYTVAIFHLVTHAFFKALLFLGAGSVIIGMHHEQDMKYMGGLRRYMPITCFTTLLGSLALIGFPFFSGFYSKESIIERVYHSQIFGANFAYFAVLIGVFITAVYSFRMYFLVFEGARRHKDKVAQDTNHHQASANPHESPWVVVVPLLLLAIPSVFLGALLVEPLLIKNFFSDSIYVASTNQIDTSLVTSSQGWYGMAVHGFVTLPFGLAMLGVLTAWFFCLKNTKMGDRVRNKTTVIVKILEKKYYFDWFNQWFFVSGAKELGKGLWKIGDVMLIDNLFVNGSANLARRLALIFRKIQTGMINHYALMMIFGLCGLLSIWFLGFLKN